MKHARWVWLVFAVCVVFAAGAIVRLGTTALDLERSEAQARRQAEQEQRLQLALWRMDSTLAPLLAEESARPYFSYSALYPAERAFTCMFAEIQKGDVLMPSPLLSFQSPWIRLHFQFGPDGRLASPLVPSGNMLDLAESRYLSTERIEEASRRLRELERRINRESLLKAIGHPASETEDRATMPVWAENRQAYRTFSNEYEARSRNLKVMQSVAPQQAVALKEPATMSQGPLQPLWVGDTLVLARRVRVDEGVFLQGCWLDWQSIRAELTASVADLVAGARLEPVLHRPSTSAPESRMLASLPARLVLSPAASSIETWWSPARFSLAVAWGCLALAAAATAWVLRSALVLSERRAMFVSAVTHELRTPLTTFRLYTEMLADGMVSDPEKQRTYHQTLQKEAGRLGHLVENVLAYARLERGRAGNTPEVLSSAELLERLAPRLRMQARQGGMELTWEPLEDGGRLNVDVSLVEQILTNLIDNAVKYAGNGGGGERISLEARVDGRFLDIHVKDDGPGLSSTMTRRLFRPFSKSAREAAHSAPGVGLGLALSRRLAQSLGGDLRLSENGPGGACFVLRLPLAAAQGRSAARANR